MQQSEGGERERRRGREGGRERKRERWEEKREKLLANVGRGNKSQTVAVEHRGVFPRNVASGACWRGRDRTVRRGAASEVQANVPKACRQQSVFECSGAAASGCFRRDQSSEVEPEMQRSFHLRETQSGSNLSCCQKQRRRRIMTEEYIELCPSYSTGMFSMKPLWLHFYYPRNKHKDDMLHWL